MSEQLTDQKTLIDNQVTVWNLLLTRSDEVNVQARAFRSSRRTLLESWSAGSSLRATSNPLRTITER